MPTAPELTPLVDTKPAGPRGFKTGMQTSTQKPMPSGGFAAVQADREFDVWLQRELGRLHGNVLHEPVPERLLRIIEDGARPQD